MIENPKILIVEDEEKVANFLKKGLLIQGWESTIAPDGSTAISLFKQHNFDIAIIDVGLPDISGLEVCQIIRKENTKLPILMLTALGSLNDKLSGYEAGIDDYMVKPFDFMELLVRIKALLKRCVVAPENSQKLLKIADLELDTEQKVAIRSGNRIELTSKEFGLLEYLMRNQGRVCSKLDIAETVWDINFDRGTNYVEVYINYLRNKIDKGYPLKLIQTVVGMGYKIHKH
jgi:two-component system, OmpR family, copper resistance phosphate regulon response regulator CusR